MRTALWERLALAVAAVVLVLAGLFLAAGGPSKVDPNSAAPSATPASSASPRTIATSPPPTAAPPTVAPVTASGSVPVPKPPTAGKYEYRETDASGTHTSTLAITDTGPGRQTENTDNGQTIDEVAWGSAGKFDLATTFNVGQGSLRCAWSPVFAQYAFPLKAGKAWAVRSSCHPNTATSITLSGTSRVSGRQRVSVAGTSVDTWIVLTDATITFSGNGVAFTERLHDVDHFAPDRGVTVQEVETTTDRDPSGKQTHDTTTRVLQNVAPGTQA